MSLPTTAEGSRRMGSAKQGANCQSWKTPTFTRGLRAKPVNEVGKEWFKTKEEHGEGAAS